MSSYQRMRELREMPLYVRKVLEAKAKEGIESSLAEQYDRDYGWQDLISVAAATKSQLHGLVDGNLKLQRIFRLVCICREYTVSTDLTLYVFPCI